MLTSLPPRAPDGFRAWLEGRPDPFGSVGPVRAPTYLPIETFRNGDPREAFQGEDVARSFRSSGTTSAERSTALFSARGLELYRAACLETFFATLRRVTGRDPLTMRGVSMVPPPSEWPDSSLAQMVAWLAEIVPVTYVAADAALPLLDEPVWVFGTAFHHVVAIDDGKVTRPLPEGSVVFETGGTKGRTRSVSREELLAMCAASYGCRIVSEYGMCELASQAYDWGDGFRFPRWVRIGAVRGIGEVTATGEGMLLVEDEMRSDYPLPLRIEDLVRIRDGGAFDLLGRAPAAPLRGCSLNVADVPKSDEAVGAATHAEIDVPESQALEARAADIRERMRSFLAEPAVLTALAAELGSQNAARQALYDIVRALPDSLAEWAAAARTAAAGRARLPRHWLFVLPRNHSLVIAYPLAMARLLGLDVSVRLPAELASRDGFAYRFASHFDATIVPPERRLPSSDAILCYGSDETVATIRKGASGFVRGYGHHVAVALADAARLGRDAELIVRDALVTAQRGCLSPRLVVMRADASTSEGELARTLLSAARAFWGEAAPPAARLGFEREAFRLTNLGFSCHGGGAQDSALIATRVGTLADVTGEKIAAACARHPMTLPVLLVKETNADTFVKSGTDALLVKSDYRLALIHELGAANAPRWNGFHLDVPLFAD
jgi:hypothetical protein